MTQRSVYSKLPICVQQALDELGIEDSDSLTPKECFDRYCQWHGFIGWNLWEVVKGCESAAAAESFGSILQRDDPGV